jgi:hypothetical protein
MSEVPNPGSREAIYLGCRCPVLDNAHGRGFPWGGNDPSFWINGECPLHGGRSFPIEETDADEAISPTSEVTDERRQ